MIKRFFENITEIKLAGIISILFLLTFIIAYPGTFTPDTMFQYQQALTGNFHPYHPPIMAKLWSIFIKISPNPSLMLAFNQMLLWASVYNFFLAFNNKEFGRIKYLYLVIPFLPYVLTYMIPIWKDVAFAFSYLLVASILTRSAITKTPLTIGSFMLCLIMLFYGTGAKYQAMFVLPIYSLWIATIIANNGLITFTQGSYLLKPFKNQTIRIVTVSLLIFIGILCSTNFASSILINHSHKEDDELQHGWQVKELYDLAGISVQSNTNYFPEYIAMSNSSSWSKLKDRYNNEVVGADSLLVDDPIVTFTSNQDNLKSLHTHWINAIIDHPFYYLKHRLTLWKATILSKAHAELIKSSFIIRYNPKAFVSEDTLLKELIFKYLRNTREFSRFIYPFILSIFFINVIRIYKRQHSNNVEATPLSFMTLSCLWLSFIYIFFSQAPDNRYLLFSQLMIYFGFPIFYIMRTNLIKKTK